MSRNYIFFILVTSFLSTFSMKERMEIEKPFQEQQPLLTIQITDKDQVTHDFPIYNLKIIQLLKTLNHLYEETKGQTEPVPLAGLTISKSFFETLLNLANQVIEGQEANKTSEEIIESLIRDNNLRGWKIIDLCQLYNLSDYLDVEIIQASVLNVWVKFINNNANNPQEIIKVLKQIDSNSPNAANTLIQLLHIRQHIQEIGLKETPPAPIQMDVNVYGENCRTLAWSPNGSKLAVGTFDGEIKIKDNITGKFYWLSSVPDSSMLDFFPVWSPDSSKLVAGYTNSNIYIWDGATGKLLHTLVGHTGTIFSVLWSPDGSKLASISIPVVYTPSPTPEQTKICIWDAATGQLLHTLTGHSGLVLSIAWSHNSTKLASGSEDKTVRIWDSATGNLINISQGYDNPVISLAWDLPGTKLAAGSADGIYLWDIKTNQPTKFFSSASGAKNTNCISWSPDRTKFALITPTTIQISDSILKKTLYWNNDFKNDISFRTAYGIAWSPDSTKLAFFKGLQSQEFYVWDGPIVHSFGNDTDIYFVTWHPDSTRLTSLNTKTSPESTGFVIYTWPLFNQKLDQDYQTLSLTDLAPIICYYNNWKKAPESANGSYWKQRGYSNLLEIARGLPDDIKKLLNVPTELGKRKKSKRPSTQAKRRKKGKKGD
jgi:WD40 repeat protein